jgi:DNA-binding protein/cold shock CspA family protein
MCVRSVIYTRNVEERGSLPSEPLGIPYKTMHESSVEANCIVDVCAKNIFDYIIVCLGKFNRGAKWVNLRAVGENINRAVKVANILSSALGIRVEDISPGLCTTLNGTRTPLLKIRLELPHAGEQRIRYEVNPKAEFIEYPIYHLLFDLLLSIKGKLHIYLQKDNSDIHLLTILPSEDFGISCELSSEAFEFEDDLASVLYRCGLICSPLWKEVTKQISEYDDVIIALDTDVLIDAVVTEHLIPLLSLTSSSEYVHTPNWLLFVVPAAVMHEIETFANAREKGRLTRRGRLGYRALQEILELEASKDIQGASILIVGEANPVLDARIELQGLRADFAFSQRKEEEQKAALEKLRLPRMSSGDAIIREQFKRFLSQIGFHKGAYFLTADKSNAALARAEGLHPIYFKRPTLREAILRSEQTGLFKIEQIKIPLDGRNFITIHVPIGKLIYELAVQFGSILIQWDDNRVRVECDTKGESLDFWVLRSLKIGKEDLRVLVSEYEEHGRIFLPLVIKVWNEVNEKVYGIPELESIPASIVSWMKGQISSINQNGYGFVLGNDGTKYFFHRSALRGEEFSQLQVGSFVEFIPDPTPPEPGKAPRIIELRPAHMEASHS